MSATESGAELLDEVRAFIARFVAFPSPDALVAVTLWTVMTHVADHLFTTPRLALLSPEPGSGKTRVLEVLALLVAAPMLVFNASAAAIFRTLTTSMRTLLFDEVDAIFKNRGKDGETSEDLRALLNSGYRRGATIPRCVGPRHDVQNFPVFAPAALAGLGELPDTIMSRSVIIRMRKRLRSEPVEPFRSRIHEPEAEPLAQRISEWAKQHGEAIGAAWPKLPPGVVDRNAELWEPLLAVADAAGGHWPDTARAACIELLKVAEERDVSLGVRLLIDLRTVFGDLDAMSTADILEDLHRLEEAPWGDLYGKPLAPRGLARMLKAYEVRSTKVKVDGKSLQGYRREDLWEAWERYAAPLPAQVEPPEPPERRAEKPDDSGTFQVPDEVRLGAAFAEPPEPPLTHEVPEVPEPDPKQNLKKPASTGTNPQVPEVPDSQEEERLTLEEQLAELGLPTWWANAEAPPVIQTAMTLTREAQATGTRAKVSNFYLVEARRRHGILPPAAPSGSAS